MVNVRTSHALRVVCLLLVLTACTPTATQPLEFAATPKPTAKPVAVSPKPAVTVVAPKAAISPGAQGVTVAAKQYQSRPAMQIDRAKKYTATIDTSQGPMKAELYANEAPETVNNFVFLARDGYYNGVPFHSVIQDFMIQTGDPTGTGTGGPGYRFNDEAVTRDYLRGTLAMANAGPNTNGSQFFIVHRDYPLPKNYTIFGKLTDGLDTLDKIATTPTGPGTGGPNTPRTPVTINSITIDES
jgi:cyclophilin family peptidyl-prolyl cis-trans isomerase